MADTKVASTKNYVVAKSGIMKYGKGRMYFKRAQWRYKGKKGETKKKRTKGKPLMITKPVGGEKNGESRLVPVSRTPRYYRTEDNQLKIKSRKMACKDHKRKLRANLTPGSILILLAGRHKGKRVVMLKQLLSGLLLVTGPFKLNSCPLRRINQRYVIGTRTKLDIAGIDIPERLTDQYFKKRKMTKSAQGEGDIFESSKETYSVTDERKEDQKVVDDQILAKIKASEDKKLLFGYLGSMFSLKNHQYPHKMVF